MNKLAKVLGYHAELWELTILFTCKWFQRPGGSRGETVGNQNPRTDCSCEIQRNEWCRRCVFRGSNEACGGACSEAVWSDALGGRAVRSVGERGQVHWPSCRCLFSCSTSGPPLWPGSTFFKRNGALLQGKSLEAPLHLTLSRLPRARCRPAGFCPADKDDCYGSGLLAQLSLFLPAHTSWLL